ncbi:MAG: SLC13 family permease, partial [Alphaproteobacteria bacterium]
MSTGQLEIFAILLGAMALFLWGRWRYDVVAMSALIVAVLLGIVPAASAFEGFGSPAVVTVAMVLVISRALRISGVVDFIADLMTRRAKTPQTQILTLSGTGGVLSAFMNNVGALALMMPLALRSVDRPSRVLMPLSFGSILGGLVTLIGTPPNIIVANFRGRLVDEPFRMFDYAAVGLPTAAIGLMFVVFLGWRLIPKDRKGRKSADELFEISAYIAEARVTEGSELVGKRLRAVEDLAKGEVLAVGLIRNGKRRLAKLRREPLEAGDVLLLRADPAELDRLVDRANLEMAGEKPSEEELRSDEIGLIEAVIPPGSRIEGRTPDALAFRRRYGARLVALARQGGAITRRIGGTRLRAGDVLLLQGPSETLAETVAELGCLPLAERGLSLGRPQRMFLPLAIFGAAIAVAALGLLPVQIAFALVVGLLILLGLIGLREAYESIDWPVIVLLGAMIPLGEALQTTGGTDLIADAIGGLGAQVPALVIVAVLLIVTMTLSDLMNNAATAVVMAPIAFGIATRMELNHDPFLMAVAIGASSAFLTPIGHQNNVLVMGPGGYRFGDYWRVGLPLEVLIVAVSVPLIA